MRAMRWWAIAAATASGSASAQSVPSTTLAPPTRDQVQRAAPPAQATPPSHLTVRGGIARAPCPLESPAFANTTLTLKGVAFDHLRGLPAEALRPAYESFLGKTVPLSTACEIRDAAAAILQQAGYVAALEVPPQQVTDGVVRFDVLMARLVRIEVRGRAGRSERLLAAYLDKLVGEPLFNQKQAERYLLLARDLPGYDVRLTLRSAGGAPGDVIGEVTASRLPLIISASMQDYGGHAVGRWGGLLSLQANDLIGQGDRLTLGFYNTTQFHEQSVVQAGYDMRLGSEGLTVGGRFTYAWTRPDLGDGFHPLSSRTLVASLEAAYPFKRSQRLDVRGVAGVDLIDQQLDLFGDPYTRDRLRVLYGRLDVGATASIDDFSPDGVRLPRWRAIGTLEARHGIGVLGASQTCLDPIVGNCTATSRPQGDASATLVRLTALLDYRLTRRLTIALGPRLQYAFNPLLSYEQYSGGAYTVGRGYDPGVIVGDSGAGSYVELRRGALSPRSPSSFAFQPYAFADAAWVWNRQANEGGGFARDRLLSAGGGVRIAWGDHARLDVGAAVPLHRTNSQLEGGDTRVLVSLTTRLVPWRSPGDR
ncbi:ShlB/FhaC/HecB family hemolysin secretion/activation protein [Sphingomonas nostoxanthinifaciens]|uniref:ShlB/FhaC/HecB family hemolysin secretion/activation protein n=1 Tax=Sphingomonas nostoxanthinifaciens TaxID=2872652 RepID=UPI001CC1E74B|nr:ShlB/FhaC/HecB family hemolysin secretion/activation protein [Sphingomonas nostoxanthinifaciens]UAK23025.1 ShlB/FhaC/HecB family hemolysin secretion/activation protein [Sphingomonas nostoxanthinifaciens]